MINLAFDKLDFSPLCRATHAAVDYPIHLKIFTNHLLYVPRSAGCDGMIGYGGGTGTGFNLARKAYGEFLERNHFFTGVPITARKPLSEVKTPTLSAKLKTLCQELQINESLNIDEHAFCFTQVEDLFNGQACDYPFNAVSLNGKKEDRHFIPFNDSCSCASHRSKDKSLLNSLSEFIERQALIGSWMARRYRYRIEPELLMEVTPYSELVKNLLDNGELYIFENGLQLPGYSVLMFYFSKSERESVQYSVGASAGLSLQKALISALEELWQCYTFQYNVENTHLLEEKAGSDYHLNFQQCNHLGVKAIIPFMDNLSEQSIDVKTTDDLNQYPPFLFNEAIAELKTISSEIYYYHHYDVCTKVHYTKILSPDFFMHMGVDKRLNLNGAYARCLSICPETAYREKIPFP